MVRQDSTQDTPKSQPPKKPTKLGLPAAVLRWRATSLMSGVGAAALVAGGLMLAPHATASGTEPVVLNPSGGTDSSNGLKVTIGGMGQVQVRRNNITQLYNVNQTPDLGGNTNLHNGYYLTLTDNSGTVKAIGVNTGNMGDSSSVENRVDWTRVTVTPVAQSGQTYTTTLTMEYDDSDHGTYKLEIDFSYTSPNDYFTQTAKITAPSGNPYTVKHYQAYDTYLGGDDRGPGYYASAPNELVYVAGGAPASPVIQGIRAKSGKFDSYFAGNYLCLFSLNDAKCGSGASSGSFVLSATPLGNYTDATKDSEGAYPDSGIGVQYNAFAAGAAGTVTYSNDMVFTSPSVQIAKTGPANAGTSTDIEYTLKLTNNGTLPVSNDIAFKDYLPAGFVYKSVAGTNVTCNGTTDISCTLAGGLAPGATATATLTVTTPSGEGTFKNVAAVNKFGLADATLVPSKADCTSSPGPNCSSVDTTVAVGTADVTATVGSATIQAGTSGTFDVTVANAAGATLSSGKTKVEFTLPADVTVNGSLPAGCTSDGATPAKITCETGDIAAGADQTFAIPVSVAAGAAVGGKTITPSASGGNDTDGVTTTAGTLTVSAANQAPTAGDDTANVEVNTATDIAVLTNDDDPDGPNANLVVQNLSTPTNGTATVNADKTVKYTPNTNYVGADSFTYEVCDASGACATGTVNITVADTQKPEVTKPADVTTDQNAAITPITVTTKDNVGVTSTTVTGLPAGVTYDASSGQITGTPTVAGDFTATITSKDAAGNTTTETFKITVTDKEAPKVTKPADVTTDQNAAITPITVTTSDNVGVTETTVTGLPAGVTYDPNTGQISGTPTVAGDFTATITSKDAAGNTTTETFKITVVDKEAPKVTKPADVATDQNAAITPISVTTSDNVGVTETTVTGLPADVTYDPNTGQITGTPTVAGESTVTVTSKDAAGNTTTETFKITVADTEKPSVEAIADQSKVLGSPIDAVTVTSGDNVGVTETTVTGLPNGVTYNSSDGTITGTPTAVGTSTVTVTVKDTAGNTSVEEFTIAVTAAPDTEAPKVTKPADVTTDQNAAITPITVTTSDNVGVTETTVTGLPAGVTYDPNTGQISGTPTVAGESTVTVTAKDAAGNTTTETFKITVVDKEAPKVTKPADVATDQNAAITPITVTTSDNVGVTETTVTDLPAGVTYDPNTGQITGTPTAAGESTVTVTAKDAAGNTTTETFKITVVDKEAPKVTKPADVATDQNAAITPISVTTSDNVGVTETTVAGLPAGVTYDPNTGQITGTPTAAGESTVTVTAKDAAGNTTTETFKITVADTEKPSVEAIADQSKVLGSPIDAVTVTSGDNVGVTETTVTGLPDGVTYNSSDGTITGTPTAVGTSTVTVTVKDAAGNTSVEEFTIAVTAAPDTEAPKVTKPADVTTDQNAAITPITVTTSDNVGVTETTVTGLPAGVTYDPNTGQITGTPTVAGESTVTVTSKDAAGNTTTETFKITVADTEKPSVEAIADQSKVLGSPIDAVTVTSGDNVGVTETTVTGLPDGVTYNSSDGTITGTPTAVGTSTVTVTVKDAAGNTSVEEFTIAVTEPADSDGDGIPDSVEKGSNPSSPVDTDKDGTPDFQDTDSDGDGIPDSVEKGPDGSNPVDTDKDGTPDYLDSDSDGDGIPDSVEKGPDGSNPVDSDKDGVPDYLDQDSDGDGIPDKVEAGPDPKNPVDTDGDGKPDYLDLDSDGDGKPDKDEAGSDPANPVDSDKDGTPDFQQKPSADADGDGIPDSVEKGSDPSSPVDTDKDGTPDFQDTDSDGDGIPDSVEAGPDPKNPVDSDKDGTPDHLDSDSDGDGIPDSVEKGPDGKAPVDTDKDGTPDYLDQDSDGDGIPDKVEAGPDPKNPVDTDGDGKPDYLDLDSDGDGALDKDEAGSDPANPVDSDKDGTPDFQQKPTPSEGDSDGDGIPDSVEKGPDPSSPVDTDGDGTPDYQDSDSDGDGIPDSVEKGPDGSKPADTDGDGKPDYLDLDSDGDTVPDSTEAGKNPASPVDTDGDGKPDYQDLDSDGDGTPDKEEAGGGGKPPVDTDKDGTPDYVDQDSDGDGFPDSDESSTEDSDGDGIPDYQDPDVTVLKGQALDASGQPLRNATLEVTLANGVKLTTTTDGDGNYEFRSAPSQVLVAGIANVVVTTADGSKAEGAAELAKGRTTIRDLALEVKPVQRQTPQPRAKVPIQVKKPKRYLAKTGSEVTELLMAAGALVGLGGAVAETARRRKRRNNQRVD